MALRSVRTIRRTVVPVGWWPSALALFAIGLFLATGRFGWLGPLPANPAAAPAAPRAAARPLSQTAGIATRPVRVVSESPDGPAEWLVPAVADLLPSPTEGALAPAAIEAWLTEVARRADRPARDARLLIEPGPRLSIAPEQAGWVVDRPATAERLRAALADSAGQDVAEPVRVVLAGAASEPTWTRRRLEPFVDQVAAALSEPLVLRLPDQPDWVLAPAEWTPLLARQELLPGVTPRLDQAATQPLAEAVAAAARRAPVNARLQVVAGRLSVLEPDQPGRRVRPAALIGALESQLLAADRVVPVPFDPLPAAVRAETLDRLGIRAGLGQGATPEGPAGDRLYNIALAAQRLNGQTIAPGEVFSFNQALGPATLAAGFRWGWGIATGPAGAGMVPAEAGGICQVATTLLQAAFWSGFEIVERHPHAFWLPNYGAGPAGRIGLDATVDEASGTDFRFRNNTNDYVLIQAATDETGLHIQLLGTNPGWQIQADEPVISRERPADYAVVRQPSDRLPLGEEMWIEHAGSGFEATVRRRVTGPDGAILREDTFASHYEPSRNIVAVGTGRAGG